MKKEVFIPCKERKTIITLLDYSRSTTFVFELVYFQYENEDMSDAVERALYEGTVTINETEYTFSSSECYWMETKSVVLA